MLIKARNDQRIDIGMIAEEEIIGTAKQLKSKKPADRNDFDMATFKNPTEGLSKPSRLTSAICQTNQKISKQNEKSHLNFYFFLIWGQTFPIKL